MPRFDPAGNFRIVDESRDVVGGMLGQKDFRIVDLNKASMCRITEFRDSETPPIPQVIDDFADQVHVTADDLVQKPKECVGTPNDVELSSRSAAASPMRETGADEFQWDLQSVHDIEEDHSCEAGEGLTGNNDMSLEEFIGEYKQIMAQDGCPEELDADEFPCTIDLGDMDHSPAFDSDLSSLSLQRMGDGESMCIGYSRLERFQYGGQHTGDDVLLPQFAQEQFPVEKEWQPGVLDGSAYSRPLRSSSCPMSSEVLSDQHVSTSSFVIHYGGQSWNSIPSAGNEDSKAQDSASGRSNPPIGDGDADATRFKNAATVKAPRYPEHPDCAISLQEIDQDRPSQTCGSVLASEGMFTDSIYGIGNATTSMAYGNGDRLTSRADVVDLTEDSDDDMECIDRRGRVGQGKHKVEDHGGDCMRKRPTVCGGRSDTTQISDSKSVAPGQMSSWQHYPFGGESRVQVRSLESNQVAQQWSATSSWHLPSSKDSVQTGHLPLLSVSKDFPHTVADKRNSTQMSPYDHSSTKRKLSAGLPSSANPASNLRGHDSGLGSEDSAPEGLAVALLKHQRLALKWMLKREELIPSGGILADDQGLGKTVTTLSLILKARAPLQKSSVNNMSALPKALTVELDDDDDVGDNTQADGCSQAMSLSGTKRSGLHHTRDIVGSVSGLHNVPETVKTESAKRRPAAGTLVVCPTSVLRQWAHEVKDKVKASADLTMLIYHGSNRTKDPDELAKYDVVLTTYSIVSMESPKQAISDEKDNEKSMSGYSGADSDLPPPFRSWKAKKPKKPVDKPNKSKGSAEFGPLARLNWFRVVLDEAQSIKNSRTQVARAAWNLKAKKRWCLSGTPIQNAIDDLYSYFRFLRCYPYDSYKVFRERIKDPCARTPAQGYKELQKCLSEVMIRRTKATLIDGQPIVDLPARIVTLKQAHFSDEERAFYNNLELESRKQFKDYAAAGTLQSNYVNILWMLLRLRQACDHPLLVKGQIYGSSTQSDVLLSAKELPVEKRMHLLSLLEASNDMCSICNDVLEHPVVCICAHIFCRQCILDQLAIGDDMSCPKCRKPLKISSVYSLSALRNPNRVEDVGGEPSACLDLHYQDEDFKSTENIDWKSSAKINAVIETLNALPPLSGDEDVKTESERCALEAGHELESEKPNGASSNGKMTKELTMVANPGRHSFVENRLLSLTDPSLLSRNLDSTSSTYGGAEVNMTSSDAAFNGGDKATIQAPKQEPSSPDALEPPKKQTATEKAIVFSQWTSMLDLLEVKLKEASFNYRRLDGTMSVVARDRAVSEFKSKPEVTVIIMSLKAASLGLNMVAACHVLLLDVWWNPTTEDQAIDRAHRIGQTRVVRVSRFTVKDTIEDRILALQEKKRRMVATAFGDERGALQRGGLTQQDMHHLFGVSE